MKQQLVQEMKFGSSTAKLSDIFEWASKNLTQVKNWLGDPVEKKACAVGAIMFWASKGERVNCPDHGDVPQRDQMNIFNSTVGDIVNLNNGKGWTFKDFAKAARGIGL